MIHELDHSLLLAEEIRRRGFILHTSHIHALKGYKFNPSISPTLQNPYMQSTFEIQTTQNHRSTFFTIKGIFTLSKLKIMLFWMGSIYQWAAGHNSNQCEIFRIGKNKRGSGMSSGLGSKGRPTDGFRVLNSTFTESQLGKFVFQFLKMGAYAFSQTLEK